MSGIDVFQTERMQSYKSPEVGKTLKYSWNRKESGVTGGLQVMERMVLDRLETENCGTIQVLIGIGILLYE